MNPKSYSLWSWWPAIYVVISLGPIARFVDGSASVFDAFLVAVSLAVAATTVTTRIDIDDEGFVRRPTGRRVSFEEVERFDARPRRDVVRIVRIVRHNGWTVSIRTPPKVGTQVLEELEARRTASRSR